MSLNTLAIYGLFTSQPLAFSELMQRDPSYYPVMLLAHEQDIYKGMAPLAGVGAGLEPALTVLGNDRTCSDTPCS